MSNPKDAPGSGADSNPEPQSSNTAGRQDDADRPQSESWFDRLRAAVGLRSPSARRELEEALVENGTDSTFSAEERTLLANILRMRDFRVSDIMIPRADVYAIEIDATLGELIHEFKESGHSRMPVYRESLDDPLGMVHVRDLMNYIAKAVSIAEDGTPSVDRTAIDLTQTVAASGLMRDILFVPASMPVASLLSLMQGRRVQMALVIDEFGGTDGVVSFEDAVETIVGDIEDEHDEEEPEIVADDQGAFIADAGARLEDVARFVGEDFVKDRDDEDVETIGGLVFNVLGRIPSAGEVVTVPGFEIVILDAEERRIRRLKIRRLPPVTEGGAEEAAEVPALPRVANGA